MLLAFVLCAGLMPAFAYADELDDAKPVMSADGSSMRASVASTGGEYVLGTWSDYAKNEARKLVMQMDDESLVGQLFLVKRSPNPGFKDMSEWIDTYHPAGFLFTDEDWKSNNRAEYINGFQKRAYIPFIIAVDQEGGPVDRLGLDSPSQKELAAQGEEAVYQDGVSKAECLARYGFNLALAPVADVASSGSYIFNRTYGQSYTGTAASIAKAVQGLEENGIGSCLKHFPGYGDAIDSHTGGSVEFAKSTKDRLGLLAEDLKPFRSGRSNSNSMVMVNHVVYPMTNGLSASVSPDVYKMLRDELGNDCVAVTDSMSMKVALGGASESESALAALKAGADLVISKYPDVHYPVVLNAVENDSAFWAEAREKAIRVLAWKIEHGIVDPDLVGAVRVDGVDSNDTLKAALIAAGKEPADDVVIPVVGDFAISENMGPSVPAGKRIIIELNGHTVKAFSDSVADVSKARPFGLGKDRHLVFQNGTILGSRSKQSFVTATAMNTSVVFKNVEFKGFDNTAKNSNDHDGGLVYAKDAQGFVLEVYDCTFTDMKAERSGGVFHVHGENSQVSISGSTFNNCVAGQSGGAIAVASGTVRISDCIFNGCVAHFDGSKSSYSTTNNLFGSAYGLGGAVCVMNGTAGSTWDVSSFMMEGNELSGTVDAIPETGFMVENSTFTGCSAHGGNNPNGQGGALWSNCIGTVLNGCVFGGSSGTVANRSEGNGGAVYVHESGNLFMKSCDVGFCESSSVNGAEADRVSQTRFGGGGVFCGGNMYVLDTKVHDCKAKGAGGGISWQADTLKLFRMYNCEIMRNTAEQGEGGGMFLGCGIDGPKETCEGEARIGKTLIQKNETKTTRDWGGGGMFVRRHVRLEMGHAVVIHNHAGGMGGGVAGCPTSDTTVKILVDVALAANTADGQNISTNIDHIYNLGDGSLTEYGQDFFCINGAAVVGGSWKSGYKAVDRQAPMAEVDGTGPLTGNALAATETSPITCEKTGWLALTSGLNPDAYLLLDDDAVVIRDNVSHNNGGGIGCNGDINVSTTDGMVPGMEFPATGGSGTEVYVVLGSAVAVLGLACLLLERKRRNHV